MKKFIMKCGHVANAETPEGKPACAICGCFDIADEQPTKEYDSYYCGCGGWD